MVIDPANFDLLGVDVGYSKRRKSTGVAWAGPRGRGVTALRWSETEPLSSQIPQSAFASIAIDGPLVPMERPQNIARNCERIFIRRPFSRRCKPGLSHFGEGLRLRSAAAKLKSEIEHFASESEYFNGPFVSQRKVIVEAFPNAFLGVLLPDEDFSSMPNLRRGKKFDWLYDRAVERGLFAKLMLRACWNDDWLLHQLNMEHGHEQRAALICVLTGGLALMGSATPIGDSEGGWFWLPPRDMWQAWTNLP